MFTFTKRSSLQKLSEIKFYRNGASVGLASITPFLKKILTKKDFFDKAFQVSLMFTKTMG
jgi:hypothetical protein